MHSISNQSQNSVSTHDPSNRNRGWGVDSSIKISNIQKVHGQMYEHGLDGKTK